MGKTQITYRINTLTKVENLAILHFLVLQFTLSMYLYDLPYQEQHQLSCMLDDQGLYETLAIDHMQFDRCEYSDMMRMARNDNISPSQKLIDYWGEVYNHTVLELFILLHRLKAYEAMEIIKQFVDEKYHFLIRKVDPVLSRERSGKILNAAPECPANLLEDMSGVSLSDENNVTSSMVRKEVQGMADYAGGIPNVPYEELQVATQNWNEKFILGRGGFGTVFKGTWHNTEVAIKKIEKRQGSDEDHLLEMQQLMTELKFLNAYRHDNILAIYLYSFRGPHPCLVYQFMPGGSLDKRLRATNPEQVLSWTLRLNIAIGIARGLQYMHNINNEPLIHGDIKSANILLDANNIPRIGDFGLARIGKSKSKYTHMQVSRAFGTLPYLPDEFLRNKHLSTKVDTYSFGVVLFEIATGLPVQSGKRANRLLSDHVAKYQGNVMDLMDRRPTDGGEGHFAGMISTGKKCISQSAKDRPEMDHVLELLQDVTDQPFFFQSSSGN